MVVDDRKELLCRAEIMNRVYLRDIANLDADISRLERLLAKEELNSTCPTPAEMLDNVTHSFPSVQEQHSNSLSSYPTVQLSHSSRGHAVVRHA